MPSDKTPWVSGPGVDDVTGLGIPVVGTFLADVDHQAVPCATAPTDDAVFPTATGAGVGTPAAGVLEAAVPAVLLLLGAGAGAAVLRRRPHRCLIRLPSPQTHGGKPNPV